MKKIIIIISVFVVGFSTGCAKREPAIYGWGEYQDIIYEMYANPGNIDPDQQVDILTTDIAKAESSGKKVPPGVHAHLGYMYYLLGNVDAAKNAFETETKVFPESKTFNDKILDNLGK